MKIDNNRDERLLRYASACLDSIRHLLQREHGEKEILLTKLRGDSGAIAVFPIREDSNRNARIIEASGVTRCEVEVPNEFRMGIGFYDAYYVQDELTAIFLLPGRDFAFVVDETNGRVIRSYETR